MADQTDQQQGQPDPSILIGKLPPNYSQGKVGSKTQVVYHDYAGNPAADAAAKEAIRQKFQNDPSARGVLDSIRSVVKGKARAEGSSLFPQSWGGPMHGAKPKAPQGKNYL